VGELLAWFGGDEDCLDYLEWLRWPDGFTCPRCDHAGGWRLGDGRIECGGCHKRTSLTAGTIFDKTRTPLTVWFHACWPFATAKDGISAQHLQRALEIGSCQTAWAMLGRLRSVLVRASRDRLAGTVEVDETYIGGDDPGLRGGRLRGRKVLTAIAVEVREPRGIGRCRIAPVADGSAESPALVRRRGGGARQHGDHRRLAGLRRHRQARRPPPAAQPAGGPRPR
jgi:transposase-like zinc ribbon protein